jgi:hypothetical protein
MLMSLTTVVWIFPILVYVYYVQKVEEERREVTSLCGLYPVRYRARY